VWPSAPASTREVVANALPWCLPLPTKMGVRCQVQSPCHDVMACSATVPSGKEAGALGQT
jgi:hypothetical protein